MSLPPVTRKRIHILLCTLVGLFVVVIVHTVVVQQVSGAELRARRARQGLRRIELQGWRGRILDRTGKRVFAMNEPRISIYITPSVVTAENRDDYTKKIAAAMRIPRSSISDVLSQKPKNGVIWIKRGADLDTVNRIREINMQGIGFIKETKRVYPKGKLGAGVVGFLGSDRGMEGIEFVCEDYLKGERGYILLEKDARGRNVPFSTMEREEPRIGMDVVLTIDQVIQHHTETALENGVKSADAESGNALVIEVDTGKILAMASYPSYDPNHFSEYSQRSFRNRPISIVNEPGSTMKPIVVASAIDAGVVDPFKDKFRCEKYFTVNGRKIHEHTTKDMPAMKSVTEIVTHSYNTGSARIAMKLGEKRLRRYLDKFNFGKKYDLELNGEERGLMPRQKHWRDVTVATVGYGYGLSATSLQMAMAYEAIANDGVLMQPGIIERVVDSKNRAVFQFEPHRIRRVLKPETAKIMRYILNKTVEEGTGVNAQISGYNVAGKTGTAKILGSSGYVEAYRASFIGMAPAENPKVLVMVLIDRPKNQYYASEVAAPVFKEIMEKSLWVMNVPPSANTKNGVVAY